MAWGSREGAGREVVSRDWGAQWARGFCGESLVNSSFNLILVARGCVSGMTPQAPSSNGPSRLVAAASIRTGFHHLHL